MIAWDRIVTERDSRIFIGYSLRNSMECDGRLRYDRGTRRVKVLRLAQGAGEYETEKLADPICRQIEAGGLTWQISCLSYDGFSQNNVSLEPSRPCEDMRQ